MIKQQKPFILTQKISSLGVSASKLLLGTLIIWTLTLQNTLAVFSIPIESNFTNAKLLASQISAPPNLIQLVRKDLSRRTKIPLQQIAVKTAKPMTWPDGCLGLAKTDEFCTQMLIQGWQIILSHNKKTWIYRTDSQGKAIRLEVIK
jgi:hypothetical protein